jgi:hypothetical protein
MLRRRVGALADQFGKTPQAALPHDQIVTSVIRHTAGETRPYQGGIDRDRVFDGVKTQSVPARDGFTRRRDPETEPGSGEKELRGGVRPGAGQAIQPTGVRREHLEPRSRLGGRRLLVGFVCFVSLCLFVLSLLVRGLPRAALGRRCRPAERIRFFGLLPTAGRAPAGRERELP